MILKDLLSFLAVDRIGLILIHFIWQATVISVITSFLLFLCKNSSARLRYIISFISLLLMLLFPVATASLDSKESNNNVSFSYDERLFPTLAKVLIIDGKYIGTQYRREEYLSKYNEEIVNRIGFYLPYLTITWLLGVLIISIYHLFGFFKLRKLVRNSQERLEYFWETKIKKLITDLGIKQKIQISKLPGLDAPIVVGCLKPVLLFPLSFFSGMNNEYLEAIILHELAHIKRFDYFFNLIQVVIEILGFFHPAVWLLSKRIRQERENCCDDIAVNTVGDKLIYVKSLVQLEECRDNRKLIVAANGGSLFNRITRILGSIKDDKNSISSSISGFVISFLCLFVIMGFIWKQGSDILKNTQKLKTNENLIKNLSNNLIAFYPFNGNANDESGFYQNGIVHNASLSADRKNISNKAFDFDGKNSYIIIPKPTSLNTTGSISVSCWIYPRSCNKYESWISKANSVAWTSQWRAGFGENNNYEWGFTESRLDNKQSIWNDYWTTNNLIPLNKWTHVAVTADQATGFVFMYINGNKIVQFDNLKSFEKSDAPLYIGYQKDDNVYFNGKIDEVRIYNRVLNDQEVDAVYKLN